MNLADRDTYVAENTALLWRLQWSHQIGRFWNIQWYDAIEKRRNYNFTTIMIPSAN